MIDVIIPAHYKNIQLVRRCIENLADKTDVSIRFIVSAQGGTRDDWLEIKDLLDDLKDRKDAMHYGFVYHRAKVTTAEEAVDEVIDDIKHDWVLVVKPWVLFNTDRWFGEMQSAFMKAPAVGGVWLEDEPMGSCALRPYQVLDPHRDLNGPAVLVSKVVTQMAKPYPFSNFQRTVLSQGSTRWIHPGINYEASLHEDHRGAKRKG